MKPGVSWARRPRRRFIATRIAVHADTLLKRILVPARCWYSRPTRYKRSRNRFITNRKFFIWRQIPASCWSTGFQPDAPPTVSVGPLPCCQLAMKCLLPVSGYFSIHYVSIPPTARLIAQAEAAELIAWHYWPCSADLLKIWRHVPQMTSAENQ